MNGSPAANLERELESMGIEKACVYDPLFEMYCCGGRKAYQRGTPHHDGAGNVVRGGNQLWDHPHLTYLTDLSLVTQSATGSKENRVYSYTLTDEAAEVGDHISQSRLTEQREELERILSDFSDKFLFVVAIGGARYGRIGGKTKNLRIPAADYSEAWDDSWVAALASTLTSTETFQTTELLSREELERVVNPNSTNDDELDVAADHEEELAKQFSELFASVLLKVPAFHKQAITLFEQLEAIGFAFTDQVFSTSGKSSTTYWRAPGAITAYIDCPSIEKELAAFASLYPLLKSYAGSGASSYSRKDLHIDLQRLAYVNSNVGIESVSEELTYLHEQGITSKLNGVPETSRPAFLIEDRERFERYLEQKIASTATSLVTT
ncbi:hypothetical protein [Haloarcula nitratireducens]|uniref:Uncharacterized protein n=1 Tax=Haloarcula nitratireducens TaxID=2487749 RepID=A0AAW4PKC8_9EURY|nr:hypothetical protein [Halomicroarcula nitratireducens]MBX0298154.1 hypothetical protein [Halomicroarcula nitratireducens]